MIISTYDCTKAAALIRELEGLRLKAYKCSAGKLTVGYGHTKTASVNQVITKHQADVLLRQDMIAHAVYVDALNAQRIARNRYAFSKNQYNALLVLAFNIPSALSVRKSTLAKLLVSADLSSAQSAAAIKTEWLRWCYEKKNGEMIKSRGLLLRRETELDLFFCKR